MRSLQLGVILPRVQHYPVARSNAGRLGTIPQEPGSPVWTGVSRVFPYGCTVPRHACCCSLCGFIASSVINQHPEDLHSFVLTELQPGQTYFLGTIVPEHGVMIGVYRD